MKAVELEMKGYGKPNMTQKEITDEQIMFDQQVYSLDFILDDMEMQEEQEIHDIILREINKGKEDKVNDHIELEGNLRLRCASENGYMLAAFHLLSRSKGFVRYFLSSKYEEAEGNVAKTKHFSILLDNLFSQMWRPILLKENDRRLV